ncbi:OB-fold nucleic acid binding domain-containing protein [Williamsia sp. 1135]|uniref:Zn-ribbon domain-containing OB-fold protein n=1 Tax=Williamsia sp. 1135 TaxID=1889262 RepID=UPI000A0F5D11|nr:OB-fold nucleic acid binding domain-containing protein [Williamsia sp. 1135]ORM35132.1 DNA-binding protein [Williamsia sp. 1135]
MSVSQISAGFAAVVAPIEDPDDPVLSAPLHNAFDYTRSLGPVLGRFAQGLIDGKIIGGRSADGTVYVPPDEFDPVTRAQIDDFVEVSEVGTVKSWSWMAEPIEGQPFSKPFGWALIELDGAGTSLLHAVAADGPDDLSTGARVHAVWKTERTGRIDDIAHFALGDDPEPAAPRTGEPSDTDGIMITTPLGLTIDHTASVEETWYLQGLKEGRLYGGRTGPDAPVYFPPRGADPTDGHPTAERVEISDKGVITTFCIVNVPFLGQQIKPPYVAAYVLLDGSDIPFLHLILDVEAADVNMGMRVEAVWRPREEWDHTLRNISHFRPSGEPDADYDSYKDHL